MASSPLRPTIIILQEIVIIIINFKEADLLYYLLPDVFTQQRRVWGTMVAVERRQPPSLGLLVSFFLIFPYICVSPPKIETVSFFAAGSLHEILHENYVTERV
jgi:hypothetical protein